MYFALVVLGQGCCDISCHLHPFAAMGFAAAWAKRAVLAALLLCLCGVQTGCAPIPSINDDTTSLITEEQSLESMDYIVLLFAVVLKMGGSNFVHYRVRD